MIDVRFGGSVRDPGAGVSVADALLAVHRSYLKPVMALMKKVTVRGLAHITGGGFPDNVPRILPPGISAVIDRAAWNVPPVFEFIARAGRVDREEMYRVFNMGIGMLIVVRPGEVTAALRALRAAGEQPVPVGNIQKGRARVKLLN